MTIRVLQNPWRLMLAVNLAVMAGVFLHKITLPPWVPYIHLVVDYQFGFIRRALIGAAVALFAAKVPVWLVFALGGAAWLLTLILFVEVFRRRVGFEQLPLFVFMAGSPFFLKNFLYTLGHFDIYGCIAALVLLLIPAGSVLYVMAAALLSALLILIHHIHFLMYVPAIAMIVTLRHYLLSTPSRLDVGLGAVALAGVGGLFLAAQFLGTMPVPETEFRAHLQQRMVDPGRADLLQFSFIWYQGLTKEIQDTWQRLPFNLPGIPVYALLIWLHAPLWRYFRRLVDALASGLHRRIVIRSLLAISICYLVMFAIVFDYSRWISNWAVCMFLVMLAVRSLPASRTAEPIAAADRRTTIFASAITLIPRVGIIRPF